MSELDKLIAPHLDSLIEEMREKLNKRLNKISLATGKRYKSRTNASGFLSKNLVWYKVVNQNEVIYKVSGTDYWRSADSGSFARDFVPPSISTIARWLDVKGLDLDANKVTDKIKKFGTNPLYSRFASDTVPDFQKKLRGSGILERAANEALISMDLIDQIRFKETEVKAFFEADLITR